MRSAPTTRSVVRRQDDIKWQDLLSHFKNIQLKHERQRRSNLQQQQHMQPSAFSLAEVETSSSFNFPATSNIMSSTSTNASKTARRKPTVTNSTIRSGSQTDRRSTTGGQPAARGTSKAPSVTSQPNRPISPSLNSQPVSARRIVSQNPMALAKKAGASPNAMI
jgi:vacuole morphology and inheritance protein 14